MYWPVLFLVSVGTVQGGFFDLTDVDDPLALLWNIQPFREKLTQCVIDENSMGVCMDKGKCVAAGGTPSRKKCGIIFTCCSFDTNCVQTSEKKVGHFKSGELNTAVTNCKYTIKLRNKNVCQIRLDFDELTLAPAILTPHSTSSSSAYVYSCANDSLSVNPGPYGVPTICGNNTRQHLYIHVNQTTDPFLAVNIDITLANRLNSGNQYLPTPKWNIKFTQLECPLRRHKFDLAKYGELESINNDFYSLAPQGAIQYFTEHLGQIRSFGFNTSVTSLPTSYPYAEHYTIAFRRPTNVCGIKFTPEYVYLLPDQSDPELTGCLDYLYIPEYYSESSGSSVGDDTTATAADICSSNTPFYSLVPGPFFINFKALGTIENVYILPNNRNLGFSINYELATSCPNVMSRR